MKSQKICVVGGSRKVTLPKQIFDLLDWSDDDEVSIKIINKNSLMLTNKRLDCNGKKDFFS